MRNLKQVFQHNIELNSTIKENDIRFTETTPWKNVGHANFVACLPSPSPLLHSPLQKKERDTRKLCLKKSLLPVVRYRPSMNIFIPLNCKLFMNCLNQKN